jgi:tRNA(fMet)-specific endonuclease VapC
MAASRVLIDTSIVIEHLRKQNRQKSILYNIVDTYALFISTIVEFELYVVATDESKRRDIQEILAWCVVLPFTSNIAQTAAVIYQQLRAKNQQLEIRDILIAATALAHDLPLMTLNTGHFNRISVLKLVSLPQL